MSAWALHNFFALAAFLKPYILVIAYCFVCFVLLIRFAITRRYRLLLGWVLMALPLAGLHWLASNYAFDPRVTARAELFSRGPAKFFEVPTHVRTLVLHDKGEGFTEMGRCLEKCLDILTSGRFERLAFKGLVRPRDYSEQTREFQIYSIVKEPGCKSAQHLMETPSSVRATIQFWELVGTCIKHVAALEVESPRIELRVNSDAPNNPPWTVRVVSVSYHDGNNEREIVRSEYGAGEIPSYVRWLGLETKVPKSIRLDGNEWRYGIPYSAQHVLEQSLGVKFDRPRERPKLSDIPNELNFEYAKRLFESTTYRERCDFVVNQIGAMRMLTEPYRSLVTELLKRSSGADADWIAWLVASDAQLNHEVLARFVTLLEGNPEFPNHLANSLRFFPPELIREMAPRLRAAAAKQPNRHSRIAATGQTVIEYMIEKAASEQLGTGVATSPRCQ
jgi:hypothetical protein